MSRIFRSLSEWAHFRNSEILKGKSLGFVPTMGALHEGHASLLKTSVSENDITVASIFVNPTQFNDPKDLEKYPRTFDTDLSLLNQCQVDFLLYPSAEEIYSDRYRYQLTENELSVKLCGKYRPGHFNGVLTVVMKLLNLVQAKHVYFGEKDYQQLKLIEGMTEAFFIPTKIIACPTVREYDGLAMSSRNRLLTVENREKAPLLYQLLKQKLSTEEIHRKLTNEGFEVEYIEEMDKRKLAAVRLGSVRLIDNVEI